MKVLLYILITLFISSSLYATTHNEDVSKLAQRLNLYAGTKASIQWKRIFTSPRHMKRYKIDSLSIQERTQLMHYLILHAADSDQPIVPGL